jgi:hypothetical protein
MLRTRTSTVYGLDPARRYALHAVSDGRVFYATDLRPGPDVVDIALSAGRTLTVGIDLPGGLPDGMRWENVAVQATGLGWQQYGHLVDASDPTWTIPAVPPGPCTVQATLERWAYRSNEPGASPERIGHRYAATAEGVTSDRIHLTLHATDD